MDDSSSPHDSGARPPDRRRPVSVYGVGSEPDARFSLANERTALAWVRTGLALVAGGVALSTLAAFADLSVFIDIVAMLACLSGGALAVSALFSWRRTERALRLDLPLPPPIALPWLIGGVLIVAVALAAYALIDALAR
ncbi:YidH family protein [Marisediminicola sp. LYQ134]|uniref:YidH family protein n=1 Tax=Marisediminicola sp. LYQ134 TaxID=3391061 RepID=UPI003983B4CD